MNFFFITSSPLIYLLIIGFTAYLGFKQSGGRRGRDFRPLVGILAGLSCCPVLAILIQLGRLNVPTIRGTTFDIFLSVGVGITMGIGYLWLAKIVFNRSDDTIASNLFILGGVAGGAIGLYFYVFHSQVQIGLIGLAWGFLFGVLVYAVILGKSSPIFRQ